MNNKNNKIVMLSYAAHLNGGVTKSTNRLLTVFPELELHPYLFCYNNPIKSICKTTRSFIYYFLKIILKKYKLTVITIASRGDVLRTLPFILLSLLFFHPYILLFRTELGAMLTREKTFIFSLVRWLWGKADAHVFLSEKLKNEYTNVFSLYSKKPTVIANVLDDSWRGLPLKPHQERTQSVVFVGRWSNEKGKSEITKAFDVKQLGRKYACHVYGSSERQIPNSNIVFHGWVSHDQLKNVISDSLILLLPSYAEAYPNVLVEAAACGTPFVATNVAGVPDIADQSGAGVVCSIGDVNQMSLYIEKIISDAELWGKMSNSGFNWAQKQSIQQLQLSWKQFFSELGLSFNNK